MSAFSRRRFLEVSAWSTTAALCPRGWGASDIAAPAFDTIIRGGHVIDPSQSLSGRRDIAIAGPRIAQIAERIEPTDSSTKIINADGKVVAPGLIDLHTHVGSPDTPLGLAMDDLTAATGLTTCVSAGDVGAPDVETFLTSTVAPMNTRCFAFVHISNLGLQQFPAPEMQNMNDIAIDDVSAALAAHPDRLLGVKVRESRDIVGDNGLAPLRQAIAAAEQANQSARVMCHIGDVAGNMADLLDLLRPGDIVTHCFSGLGNNIVQAGKLLPAAREAQARGVIFDVGHGGGSFDFTVAQAAIEQGLRPDTLSSDLHQLSIETPGKPYLPWVMSKFLSLGFSLEDVIAMTTAVPGNIINRVPGMGTLQTDAPADITILDVVDESCTFWDTRNQSRTGERYLRPVTVLRAGSSQSFPPTATRYYP